MFNQTTLRITFRHQLFHVTYRYKINNFVFWILKFLSTMVARIHHLFSTFYFVWYTFNRMFQDKYCYYKYFNKYA